MIFPAKILRFCFFSVVMGLAACADNDELRAYRDSIPARLDNAQWQALVPLGRFAAFRPEQVVPDPQSLAQRATALRAYARTLNGPVLDASRKRLMLAALARYN